MIKAIWKDGTETVRETHTRGYKFAYKATTVSGCIAIGFSTSLQIAESTAKRVVNSRLKNDKDMAKMAGDFDYPYSAECLKLTADTKEALKNIEIVKVV